MAEHEKDDLTTGDTGRTGAEEESEISAGDWDQLESDVANLRAGERNAAEHATENERLRERVEELETVKNRYRQQAADRLQAMRKAMEKVEVARELILSHTWEPYSMDGLLDILQADAPAEPSREKRLEEAMRKVVAICDGAIEHHKPFWPSPVKKILTDALEEK